jgi:hypothetical protein
MKSISPTPELVVLYDKMQKHTIKDCNKYCNVKTCCQPEYCERARRFAKERYNVTLEDTGQDARLPFMTPTGCVVPPHLRPECTVYVCCIRDQGQRHGNPKWTERYYDLRKQIFWLELSEKKDV